MRIPATLKAWPSLGTPRTIGWWGRLSALSFGAGGIIGLVVALGLARPDSAVGAATVASLPGAEKIAAVSGRVATTNSSEKTLEPLHQASIEAALTKARPFKFWGPRTDKQRAADCLAAAAWYEIGDDHTGQRAVVQTVINRVNHPGFPNSVCGVVFEGSRRSTGCQFTFTCDGSLAKRRPSTRAWERALAVANEALDGFVDGSIGSATHYHADYVTPWWSSHLERLTAVGPHIFYRWSGSRGALRTPARLDAEMDYDALVGRSFQAGSTDADTETVPDENAELTAAEPMATAAANTAAVAALAPKRSANPPIFLQVNAQQASGRWAVSAMKACAGKKNCQVIAYDSAASVSANKARNHAQFDRPRFLFLRDAKSGMDIALWDCERVSRPSSNQCLPGNGAALKSLLAER
ncbi:cell wall hydrolase [Erythrobacter sp. THAF29]|uniref:cell wall hydrolase n=1 Tax=Erythrobacter sp. THAF29 TaxID=2587851 RepID=UPI001269879E|nr:cell wall hydrolase [Erythrobacter sp. THAF29]QFT77366.1 Spore cortex-lytic enzyme precursor [Erythrobacter sp. THAF29]